MAVCHGAIFIIYLFYYTQVISPKVKVYLPLGATPPWPSPQTPPHETTRMLH
jgi:hypothetical protein